MVVFYGQYKKIARLAKSEFGSANVCLCEYQNKLFVLKFGGDQSLVNEFEVLKKFKGFPYVVQVIKLFEDYIGDDLTLFLVMEACYPCKTIEQKIESNEVINEADFSKYLFQIIRFLNACIQKNVLVVDLNLGNVLLNNEGNLFIIDAGLWVNGRIDKNGNCLDDGDEFLNLVLSLSQLTGDSAYVEEEIKMYRRDNSCDSSLLPFLKQLRRDTIVYY
jgi:serine/threonine protein kinase